MTQVMSEDRVQVVVSSEAAELLAKMFGGVEVVDNAPAKVGVEDAPLGSASNPVKVKPGKNKTANGGPLAKLMESNMESVFFASGCMNVRILESLKKNGWKVGKRVKKLEDKFTKVYNATHKSGVKRTLYMGRFNKETQTKGRKEAVLA